MKRKKSKNHLAITLCRIQTPLSLLVDSAIKVILFILSNLYLKKKKFK